MVLAELDTSILERFTKTAKELRRVAPKANDFLYFTAIFIHAAEASLIDDNGVLKKNAKGDPVDAGWEINEKTGSWKWVGKNTDILPYKNSNGDIFPESELKLAYKKWIGRPLCQNHESSSVEGIRGIIVDAYYDNKLKRVIGLCALDKINYPDLARKVSTGYCSNFSMGCGVSRVCCFTCGKMASIEKDFCEHMKKKNSYGEINTGLSPIEISIVVTPADPKCTLKSVIASANTIEAYINNKESLLPNILSSDEFDQLEEDLSKAQESLKKLKKVMKDEEKEVEEDEVEKEEDTDENDIQGGIENMPQTELENTDRAYNLSGHFAGENDLNSSDRKLIFAKLDGLEEKINNFINKMASIEKTNNFNEDTDMVNEKKAYFQGGGEGNEPDPKGVKYPKEDSDKIREKEDKHMNLEPSNLGGADGLFPGDEAKKKELLRAAELKDRAMRREAALESAKKALKNKEAYFNGGGDVNEPTPGKPKYPKEDSDKIREKEDKQQVGAPPFPGVGKLDGLYNDDLKTKEMLHRATLNARFIKAANADGSDNIGNSGWHVFSKSDAGEKLILTATVSDIAGDKAEAFYDSIATKAFGSKIINTIKTQGFEKAVKMYKGAQSAPHLEGLTPGAQPSKDEADAAEGYKVLHNEYPADFVKKYPTYRAGMNVKAQAAPAMPAGLPAMPADSGLAPSVPGDKSDDKGADGNPVEQIDSQLGEVDNLIADMKKTVEALKDEDTSDLSGSVSAKASSVSLPEMRKTLNSALQKGAKQALAELEDNKEELQLIKNIYENSGSINNENSQLVSNIVSAALVDAKTTTANVYKLMSAFVKYARGTDALVKKAAEEAKMNKSAQEAHDPNDWKKTLEEIHSPPASGLAPNHPNLPTATDPKNPPMPKLPGNVKPVFEAADGEMDKNDVVNFEVGDDGKVKGTADSLADVKASEDLNTPEGRAVMRAKIAQKGLKFSDMLSKGHPKGSVTVPDLDTKPTGNLAVVEDLEDIHDAMMDIATKATPKVRTAAEQIQKLVVAGKIDPNKDFDGLIAEGLDSAAVSYWKKFYGEAKDGGSAFAAELVKNYEGKKSAKLESTIRVKVARAYELAHDMADRGMIGGNHEAIKEQVDEILTYNEASFSSLARMVGRQKPLEKTASHLPVVGYAQESMIGAPGLTLPGVNTSGTELKDALEACFNTPSRSYGNKR